ncbi:MAG: hypothetical protein ACOYO9_11715 [Candidatus Nanopelagicales bacterium]
MSQEAVSPGVFGFRLVTRFLSVVTVVSIAMIIAFIALTIGNVNWTSLGRIEGVSVAGCIGAGVIAGAAFGLSWTNSGADYSRYLPRGSSSRGIVGWTTFAGSPRPRNHASRRRRVPTPPSTLDIYFNWSSRQRDQLHRRSGPRTGIVVRRQVGRLEAGKRRSARTG